jgi:hypothetical protein
MTSLLSRLIDGGMDRSQELLAYAVGGVIGLLAASGGLLALLAWSAI